jgi:soluble lytic murein transglycosylase-like protein
MRLFITSIIAIFALSLFLETLALADIYTHTDKNGTVHFTNQRPTGRDRRKYKVYLKSPPQRKARPGVVPVLARDKDSARYSKFDASILEAAQTFSVPEAFIRAVIRVESDYDPRVVSHAGAQGLMQLMPATAKRMNVTNSFDPHDNIMGGTRYLRYLANMFGGDMVLTISGYHAG